MYIEIRINIIIIIIIFRIVVKLYKFLNPKYIENTFDPK